MIQDVRKGFDLRGLFNDWESSTPEGHEIFERVLKALEPIMKDCVAKGIRVRDVSHEMIAAVTILEAETVLIRNIEKQKADREAAKRDRCSKGGSHESIMGSEFCLKCGVPLE